MVVLAVAAPWPGGHVLSIHEFPIGHVGRLQPKVIAHRGRNIEAGTVIQVWLRFFVPKDILEVVRAEGPAVFPLRVAGAIAFADRDPAMPANRLSLPGVGL